MEFKEGEIFAEPNKKVVILDHYFPEEKKFRKDVELFLEDIPGTDTFNIGKIKDYHIFKK